MICSYCEAKSICRHAKQAVRAKKKAKAEDIYRIMKEVTPSEKKETDDAN